MKVEQTIRQLISSHGQGFVNVGDPGKCDAGFAEHFSGIALWGCMCMGENGSRVALYTRGIDWFLGVFDTSKVQTEWESNNPEWLRQWSEDRHAWKVGHVRVPKGYKYPEISGATASPEQTEQVAKTARNDIKG